MQFLTMCITINSSPLLITFSEPPLLEIYTWCSRKKFHPISLYRGFEVLNLISTLCFFVLLSSYNNIPAIKRQFCESKRSSYNDRLDCKSQTFFLSKITISKKSHIPLLLCISMFCCPLKTTFLL